jgi:hypothetical protein
MNHPFACTKNFLLPLQIKMNKLALKLGKVLKIIGIGLLIGISVISWIQVGNTHERSNSSITCDGDSSDTIIMAQERFRGRVFFDILKTFITSWIQNSCVGFQFVNSNELKSLLVNGYQRNVFYVYTFSTVP